MKRMTCLDDGLEGVKKYKDGKVSYDKDLKKHFIREFGDKAHYVNSGGKWWEGIAFK